MAAAVATGPETGRRTRALVLYDGQCPLCLRSVKILKKLDWLKRLDYQSAREEDRIPALEPPLDRRRLLEEMHVLTPGGKVLRGFGAFRWMAWRLPLVLPAAPFLYLPGVPALGNRIYRWVARNRFKLVPCKDGACELGPGRSP